MRVLIVKTSSLGDVIHTLPAVTDAWRARRDLVFDWVVEEAFAEVPAWHPAVATVIPVAVRRWRRQWRAALAGGELRAFRERLQAQHYDLVIDAQGLIKSGIISRLSRGITVGLADDTIREPLATLFYNQVYSVPWNHHAIERVRELFARALGYTPDPERLDYGVDRQRLAGAVAGDPADLIFLHGTTWDTKHWPEPYWRELAQRATLAGLSVALPWGSESERARAEAIARDLPGARVLPRLGLAGLAAQFAQARAVVSVDTGLGHLAAALAVPTLSLYGPTDPELTGTRGAHQHHLRVDYGCSPCRRKTCGHPDPDPAAPQPPCFTTLGPDRVWSQLSAMLQDAAA